MMWSSRLALLLTVFAATHRSCALVVQSTRVPLKARDQQTGATLQAIPISSSSGALDRPDIRYAANITLNGKNFRVAIDTGSADLWIVPPKEFGFNDTGIPIVDGYLGGNVDGTIGFSSMELGGYSFKSQAFNNATTAGLGGIVDLGLDGLIGLSFGGAPGLTPISKTLQRNGRNASLGQPFLFNIFDQTPLKDNFIGISLSRTDDLEGSAAASFSINEVDLAYAAVLDAPSIPLFPADSGLWSILLDGISVDGTNITFPPSTVPGTPRGKAVAIMDTGTPTALLPELLVNAIYSQIPGARLEALKGSNVWTVPCNTTSIVSVQIASQAFPIHPLDLSDVVFDNTTDRDVAICASRWGSGSGGAQFDVLFGDSFMRNVYSVLNFGDSVAHSPTGKASMQLLSQTDATAAIADVLNVRMALLSSLPASGVTASSTIIPNLSVATNPSASNAPGAMPSQTAPSNAGSSPSPSATPHTSGGSSTFGSVSQFPYQPMRLYRNSPTFPMLRFLGQTFRLNNSVFDYTITSAFEAGENGRPVFSFPYYNNPFSSSCDVINITAIVGRNLGESTTVYEYYLYTISGFVTCTSPTLFQVSWGLPLHGGLDTFPLFDYFGADLQQALWYGILGVDDVSSGNGAVTVTVRPCCNCTGPIAAMSDEDLKLESVNLLEPPCSTQPARFVGLSGSVQNTTAITSPWGIPILGQVPTPLICLLGWILTIGRATLGLRICLHWTQHSKIYSKSLIMLCAGIWGSSLKNQIDNSPEMFNRNITPVEVPQFLLGDASTPFDTITLSVADRMRAAPSNDTIMAQWKKSSLAINKTDRIPVFEYLRPVPRLKSLGSAITGVFVSIFAMVSTVWTIFSVVARAFVSSPDKDSNTPLLVPLHQAKRSFEDIEATEFSPFTTAYSKIPFDTAEHVNMEALITRMARMEEKLGMENNKRS
ncbi:aspartic peptidase domain-containing protein [Mycena epipterygia]|nr:aspartic peptidase domain-containing protein [Mycena epipterygia]